MHHCFCCGHEFGEEEEIFSIYGNSYCDDCVIRCERCGRIVPSSDTTSVQGDEWCESCADAHSFCCEDCDRLFPDGEANSVEGGNRHVCDDCISNYSSCAGCGNYTNHDDMYYEDDEDDGYCRDCWDNRSRMSGRIRDYGFRIEPLFQFAQNESSHAYVYGVELEVDGGGHNDKHSNEVYKIMDEKIINKHDGSLSSGFEIVSYPCSLAMHKEMNWRGAMKYLIENKYRSHDTDTCGLHVHINRDCLGASMQQQEQTIAKMLLFIELNWTSFVKFTRRKQGNLDRWAKRYGVKKKDTAVSMLNKAKCSDRYRAINLNPRHTVEIRAFRGTLNHKTFYAALEFVDSMVHFCRHKTVDEVMTATLGTIASHKKAPYLLKYMVSLGLMDAKQDDIPNLRFEQGELAQVLRNSRTVQLEEQNNEIIADRTAVVQEVYNNRYRLSFNRGSYWMEESDVTDPIEIDPIYSLGSEVEIVRDPINVQNYETTGCIGRVIDILESDCETGMDGRYVVELENDYVFIYHGSCLRPAHQAEQPSQSFDYAECC